MNRFSSLNHSPTSSLPDILFFTTHLMQKWFFESKSELFPESGSVSGLEEVIAKAMADERDTSQARVQLACINHFLRKVSITKGFHVSFRLS